MEEDEDISKVLFELSSNRRANILFGIQNEKLKMQQIAKTLDMTTTETFRHLQRLSEAKLVEKNTDGTYSITSLGRLGAGLLSSFNFFLKNGNYFLEHNIFNLPYEFVNRLGELSNGDFIAEAMSALNRTRKIVYASEEFLWVMAEEVDTSHTQVTSEKVSMGLKFRFIMQGDLAKTFGVSPEMMLCPHCRASLIKNASKFKDRKCNYCERRQMERINLSLLINEKEACIFLRRPKGEMDYAGFFGTDEKFRKWCQDIFMYHWDKAEKWYPTVLIK